MKKRMPPYVDLASLPEDTRISLIGSTAESGGLVAFVVESEEKADRYVKKLTKRFRVKEVERFAGPTETAITVKIGPRIQ